MKKRIYLLMITTCLVSMVNINNTYNKVNATKTNEKVISANEHKQKLLELGYAFVLSKAIHTAADLKIADALENNPLTLKDLASKLNYNELALYRLMRVLVSHGIFEENENHEYMLTELSKLLIFDDKNLFRVALAKEMDERWWNALGHLSETVQSGKPAFEEIYKESWYDYLENNESARSRFDQGMSQYSEEEDKDIADKFNFSNYKTIIDVGGNKGGLLSNILKTHKSSQGIIFDLLETTKNSKEFLKNIQEIEGRYEVAAGSFFEENTIPQKGNLYILKRVIHNWDDSQSVKILKNCANQMSEDGRILVIDTILPSDHSKSLLKDVDVLFSTLGGGLERTLEEFKNMFKQAGLELKEVHKTGTRMSIMEVIKK
jgi:predicted transcriptional regulator